MSIFTAETRLNPELMLRQIEVAVGQRIFSPETRLDQELMIRQLEAVIGKFTTDEARLSPETLLAQIDNALAAPSNATPTDIAWAGSHTVAEDASLGTAIGGALSFVDPDAGATGTFSIPDATSKFAISGTNIIVAGVLDYETATSHNVTIRFTDQGGLYYEETFPVTVTDVSEGVPDPDAPPDDGEVEYVGEFDVPPSITVTANGDIKIHGKKKTGVAKILYALGAPLANRKYTMEYDTDFSLMSNQGKTAAIGFTSKTGNDFHLAGQKGDGATGLDTVKIFGDDTWNLGTGYTTTVVGDVAHGTQAGPNWVQVENEASTYDYRSSGNSGVSFDEELSNQTPTPFANIAASAQFGIGIIFEALDEGPFVVLIKVWQPGVHAGALRFAGASTARADSTQVSTEQVEAPSVSPQSHRYWSVNITSGTNYNFGVPALNEIAFTTLGDSTPATAVSATATSSHGSGNYPPSNAIDGNFGSTWIAGGTLQRLALDYGSPIAANTVHIHSYDAGTSSCTMTFTVDYSDNGTNWTTDWSVTAASMFGGNNAFPKPAITTGEKVLWRIFFQGNQSNSRIVIAEWQLRDAVGGVSKFISSNHTWAESVFSSAVPALMIDGNSATWFTANTSFGQGWVAYEFEGSFNAKELMVQAATAGNNTACPSAFTLTSSADGVTWVNRLVVSGLTWGVSEIKTWPIGVHDGAIRCAGTGGLSANASGADPYWANVVTLIGPNGADASTTFTDESPSAHGNATVNGNAQVDTGVTLISGVSAQFDGTGDWLSYAAHADWAFGSVYTIDVLGVRFNSVAADQAIGGQYVGIGNASSWLLRTISTGAIQFLIDNGINGFPVACTSADSVLTTNVTYNIRVDSDGTTCRLYLDGVMVASDNTGLIDCGNATIALGIGASADGGRPFNGRIEDIRFTKGVARTASNSGFTKPVARFPRG